MAHILVPRAALALSDDAGVECILTGIPLLCTGILSIGVFTFFVVMKRVDFLIVHLFVSCFFGFIAAIIDLGQILIRGHTNVANGLGLGEVTAFIRAREVFLSFAVGFLYLFYWLFAGRRPTPQDEESADVGTMKGIPIETMTVAKPMHCASWERWGYVGIGLRWGTLLACLLIMALQIVWRLAPKHHVYGDLYVASATMETTISAIFILKLLLNFYLAPLHLQRRVILNYIAPIAAFIISAGIGVGNLVVFAFSETSLGRFLRGIEVYLLVIYYLILTFRTPDTLQTPKSLPAPVSSNERKEKVGFGTENPPSAQVLPTLGTLAATNSNLGSNRLFRISRISDISKISSWVASNRDSRRSIGRDQSNSQIWLSPPKRSLLLQPSPVPTAPSINVESSSNSSSEDARDTGLSPPRVSFNGDGRLTNMSFSYYAMESDPNRSKSAAAYDSSTLGSASPIYGLDGIILPHRNRRESKDQEETSDTRQVYSGEVTPVSRLIQEQSAIDQSIASLRRQIDRGENKTSGGDSVAEAFARNTMSTTSNLTNSKPSSPNPSDFSLSVFPDPPPPPSPQTSFKDIPSAPPIRPTLRPNVTRRAPKGVIPIQLDIPSGLSLSSDIATASPKFDSAGTQYDVTSFIGDLSGPQSGYPFSGNITSSGIMPTTGGLDDIQSGDESETTPTQRSPGGTSPLTPLSRTPSRPLGSATMSSRSFPKPTNQRASMAIQPPRMPPQNMALRTFMARNGSTSIRVGPPSGPRHSRSSSLTSTIAGQGKSDFLAI